jgi:hypothetical protein
MTSLEMIAFVVHLIRISLEIFVGGVEEGVGDRLDVRSFVMGQVLIRVSYRCSSVYGRCPDVQ